MDVQSCECVDVQPTTGTNVRGGTRFSFSQQGFLDRNYKVQLCSFSSEAQCQQGWPARTLTTAASCGSRLLLTCACSVRTTRPPYALPSPTKVSWPTLFLQSVSAAGGEAQEEGRTTLCCRVSLSCVACSHLSVVEAAIRGLPGGKELWN